MLEDLDALTKDGLHGIEQIVELVTNLRNFSRLDRSKVASFNVNEGVRATLLIAKPALRKVDVERKLGDIPSITCSPSQVNQVLLNLVTNAAQAMDKPRGRITVVTREDAPGTVAIEVEDNGKGIAEESLPKIFDPFYHDEGRGQGHGPGPHHRLQDREAARRPHRRAFDAGRGHDGDRDPARGAAGRSRLPRRVRDRGGERMNAEIRKIGKYTLESPIGKGSWASVYRGTDGSRAVALKVLPRAPVGNEALDKMRQNASALARVRHPVLANFVELVVTDKAICVVSELAEGTSLATRLEKDRRPDLRQTWDIVRQVLEALDAAHSKGVYHGDIKPSNIILDAQNRVKLTDLGIRPLAPESAGNPAYMAPEQFSDIPGEARTDLYQVGALVYHLVSGKVPFTGSREEVIHRVLQERPADPSTFTPKIAWQLDWVIQRALSKDPMDRFGTARELVDGLRLGLQDSIGSPLAAVSTPPAPAPEPAPAPAPAAPPAPKPAPAPAAKAAPAPAKVAPAPAPKPAPAPAPAAKAPAAEKAAPAKKMELTLEARPGKPAPEVAAPAARSRAGARSVARGEGQAHRATAGGRARARGSGRIHETARAVRGRRRTHPQRTEDALPQRL